MKIFAKKKKISYKYKAYIWTFFSQKYIYFWVIALKSFYKGFELSEFKKYCPISIGKRLNFININYLKISFNY